MKGLSRVFLLFLSVYMLSSFYAIPPTPAAETATEINWMSMEEAVRLSELGSDKKFFIDVYTDWCGWCKRLDVTTFRDPKVMEVMDKYYHAVKFDAEQRESITLKDTEFSFISSGKRGYHELAAALLNGQMSYPSMVFLNQDFEMIQPLSGYQEAAQLALVLEYIGGDFYKRDVTWEDFTAQKAAKK